VGINKKVFTEKLKTYPATDLKGPAGTWGDKAIVKKGQRGAQIANQGTKTWENQEKAGLFEARHREKAQKSQEWRTKSSFFFTQSGRAPPPPWGGKRKNSRSLLGGRIKEKSNGKGGRGHTGRVLVFLQNSRRGDWQRGNGRTIKGLQVGKKGGVRGGIARS